MRLICTEDSLPFGVSTLTWCILGKHRLKLYKNVPNGYYLVSSNLGSIVTEVRKGAEDTLKGHQQVWAVKGGQLKIFNL